jgi:hypothetical protein
MMYAWYLPVLALVAASAASGVVTEQKKITLATAQGYDLFGSTVSLSGDTAVIGAALRDQAVGNNAGAAFVYERDQNGPGNWGRVAELLAANPMADDEFGTSVAVQGSTALVGARYATKPGHGFASVEGLARDPSGGALYGSDTSTDTLVSLDTATGEALAIGALGFDQVRGLAFDPGSGTLYGTDTSTDQLITIDTASGAGSPVGPTGFALVSGLAFDPTGGTLFGSDVASGQLITIDPLTGAGTAVGSLGFPSVHGLAFDLGAGVLYGTSANAQNQARLLVVDTATGAATKVGVVGIKFVDGLALDAGSGLLFGCDTARKQLLTIDVGTAFGMPLGGAAGPDTGAVYVFARDQDGPGQWGLVDVLSSHDANVGDFFGWAVALDGNTAAVAAVGEDGPGGGLFGVGAVYVFERDAGGFLREVAKLAPAAPVSNELFGTSLAIDGDRIAVGALGSGVGGAVFVFERDAGGAGAWGQVATLSLNGANQWDDLGRSVAIQGERVVVGANGIDHAGLTNSGAAYVFERDAGGPGNWGKVAKLIASDIEAGDVMGHAVALYGETILVGATGDDHSGLVNTGACYVYQRDHGGPGAWDEVEKFFGSAPDDGDIFGSSLALTCDTALVGAERESETPTTLQRRGAAFVFDVAPAPAATYCTAGVTGSGCSALVSAAGTARVSSPSGFDVSTTGGEGQKDGTFYFSTHGAQANTWGNGTSYQCVVPPVTRTGVLQGSGTVGGCDGLFQLDFNTWMTQNPTRAPAAGETAYLQCWFRDPKNTSNQSTSLSDALRFFVCP